MTYSVENRRENHNLSLNCGKNYAFLLFCKGIPSLENLQAVTGADSFLHNSSLSVQRCCLDRIASCAILQKGGREGDSHDDGRARQLLLAKRTARPSRQVCKIHRLSRKADKIAKRTYGSFLKVCQRCCSFNGKTHFMLLLSYEALLKLVQ